MAGYSWLLEKRSLVPASQSGIADSCPALSNLRTSREVGSLPEMRSVA